MLSPGDVVAFLNQIFPVWIAAPRPIRWLLIIWGFTTIFIVIWVILTFKLKPLLLLWSVAPTYLKLILMLWLMVTVSVGGWWLAWRGRQQRRIIGIKSQRILDDFRQFLNQQLPQHKESMEAITTKISSHFPTSVGPQGAEIKAQIKAACDRRQEIRNHWQSAQRGIKDLTMEVGLSRVTDPAIIKQIDDIGKDVERVTKLVQETIRDRYFKDESTTRFDEAWATVCSEHHPAV